MESKTRKTSRNKRKRETHKVNYNEQSSEDSDDSVDSSSDSPVVKKTKSLTVKIKIKKDTLQSSSDENLNEASSSDDIVNTNGDLSQNEEESSDGNAFTCRSSKNNQKCKSKTKELAVKEEKPSNNKDQAKDGGKSREKNPTRKGKKKKVVEESMDEDEESDEEEEEEDEAAETDFEVDSEAEKEKKTKKKTGRKKKVKKETTSKADKKKAGRREIKTILKSNQLKEETKDAEKQEEERRKRLQQKAQNLKSSLSESEKIVLQSDPTVAVHPEYSRVLKPHQVEGVQFIWDNMVESTEQAESSPGGGCILAHCMGLGKTLQTIVFTSTVLNCPHLKLRTCLVVTPLNTLNNWLEEFKRWTSIDQPVKTHHLMNLTDRKERIKGLEKWQEEGGVLVIGYELFRRLAAGEGIRYKPWKVRLAKALLDPGPDMIVCDEGHRLKNSESAISVMMSKISTKRRLILTGTPLQNNLAEYHCMVHFIKPNLLGSLKEFRNRFVNPISNGQHLDSTTEDVALMRKRSHVLFELLRGFVQRKDYTALQKYLCEKHEYILKIRLSKIQQELYREYISRVQQRLDNGGLIHGRDTGLFADYQTLMRVWTHPRILQLHSKKKEQMNRFVVDDSEEEEELSEEENDSEASESGKKNDDDSKAMENGKNSNGLRATRGSNSDTQSTRSCRKRTKVETKGEASTSKANDDEDFVAEDGEGDDEEEEEAESDEGGDDEEGEESDDSVRSFEEQVNKQTEREKHRKENTRLSRVSRYQTRCEQLGKEEPEQKTVENTSWYYPIVSKVDEKVLDGLEIGAKIAVLLQILQVAAQKDDKVLVFSQSLLSLDLIEDMLKVSTEKALCQNGSQQSATKTEASDENKEGENGDGAAAAASDQLAADDDDGLHQVWHKNVDYYRMDGSSQNKNRHKWINEFNDEDDRRSRLFLISTKAGSLGVNLVAANRVVVFDASWNPSHDIQSIFRVYRFGQKKKCFIYRLIAQGTMEEKIYERQVTKQSLSFRVVDEQQINRHFNHNDLKELYKFTPAPELEEGKAPNHILPKDDLLADLLMSNVGKKSITSYHRHDSLLDHQEDQELTEEERQSAWADYNRERANPGHPRPAPRQSTSTFQMPTHKPNQMLPGTSFGGLHNQNSRAMLCLLSPEENEELERMQRFHNSMAPFFQSVSTDKRVFVDNLFALLLKLKRNIIMGNRKLLSMPPIRVEDALENLRRMGPMIQLSSDMNVLARTVVNQRTIEREECQKKLREQQSQFEWVLQKYQNFLSDTPVFQAMSNSLNAAAVVGASPSAQLSAPAVSLQAVEPSPSSVSSGGVAAGPSTSSSGQIINNAGSNTAASSLSSSSASSSSGGQSSGPGKKH